MKPKTLSTELALYLGLIKEEKFCSLMGISSRTSRLWRQKGVFPYIRIRKKVYYRLKDIRDTLEENYYRNKPLKNRR